MDTPRYLAELAWQALWLLIRSSPALCPNSPPKFSSVPHPTIRDPRQLQKTRKARRGDITYEKHLAPPRITLSAQILFDWASPWNIQFDTAQSHLSGHVPANAGGCASSLAATLHHEPNENMTLRHSEPMLPATCLVGSWATCASSHPSESSLMACPLLRSGHVSALA